MDEKENSSRAKALSDEVLRKIGRNVLLFQQIEGLLKYLMSNHHADGTITDFAERQQKRGDIVKKLTMGNLVDDFADKMLSDAGELTKVLEKPTQPWMRTTFTFESTDGSSFFDNLQTDMKQMVAARNDLVHHFLHRWQPDSIERLTAATNYLDEQHEKVLPLSRQFETFVKALQAGRQELVALWASKEWQCKFELMWLQQSPLIALLTDTATKNARPDGWAFLSQAGSLARVHEAEAVMNLKERYGHSTLKQLLIASELFDVWDEPLANEHFRTVYRLKRATAQ